MSKGYTITEINDMSYEEIEDYMSKYEEMCGYKQIEPANFTIDEMKKVYLSSTFTGHKETMEVVKIDGKWYRVD